MGVTVLGYPDAGTASGYRFRIALASVAPTPAGGRGCPGIPGEPPRSTAETFKQAARLAQEACSPIDDVRGSARYRKAMVRKLTEKALEQYLGQVWRYKKGCDDIWLTIQYL